MNGQVHTIPDDTAAHYERLIVEAEKMRQAGADALKDAYRDLRSDLKAIGWLGPVIAAEVAAFKGAIAEMALAEADKTKREEKGERVDDYVSLLTRARARGQRKNDERFNPITGEFVDDEEVDDNRSDAGLSIVTKHTEITASPVDTAVTTGDDLREPVAAEQGQIIREGDAPRETDRLGGDASCPDTDQPLKGGDEDLSAVDAPTSKTGEGTASALPHNSGVTLEYVPSSGVKRLPFASCFPELSKADYERLEKDIAANRVDVPIIRQGDVIVDGWARYTIARKYGFAYPVEELHPGRDVLLLVIELQRASRNFTLAQSAKIAADLAKEFPSRADEIMAAFGLAEALEAAE